MTEVAHEIKKWININDRLTIMPGVILVYEKSSKKLFASSFQRKKKPIKSKLGKCQ